jgi:NitT/TauT family transport system ATP-binding protein
MTAFTRALKAGRQEMTEETRGVPVTASSVVTGSDAAPPAVDLSKVSITYEKQRAKELHCAVQEVSFSVAPGEFVALVGPSGCGKSSLLSAMAGLVPYQGELHTQGQPVSGPRASTSMVFQAAALFPWRTVADNVGYGLELRGVKKAESRARVAEMLYLVGLDGMAQSYPHEMSGGMQQRVNLARALAVDPEILLLDEPFAALDAQTREEMQDELLRIWQETKKTSILVTHQIDEALLLADRVIVMSRGPRSRIREVIHVTFPRPRTDAIRSDPSFVEMSQRISGVLKEERRRDRDAD